MGGATAKREARSAGVAVVARHRVDVKLSDELPCEVRCSPWHLLPALRQAMKIWVPKWPDGCRSCRTKTRLHMGQGYCSKCYRIQQKAGTLQLVRRDARIRSRGGVKQYFCFDCEIWKSETEFLRTKKGFRTRCHECNLRIRAESRAAKRDELNAERRARSKEITRRMREADRVRKKRLGDPWGRHNPFIPVEPVLAWLQTAMDMADENTGKLEYASIISGLPDRRLYDLRTRPLGSKVSVDVAEKLARAVDAMEEFRELTKPGIHGWSKQSDFCLRCGRYDVPHRARGLCQRCYQVTWWHEKRGRAQPPFIRGERWSMWHSACVLCKSSEHPHRSRGVCTVCYRKEKSR